MKYFKIPALLLLSLFLSLSSCNDQTKTPKDNNSKAVEVKKPSAEPSAKTPATTEPAQNTAGVWHYTCRIGCPGGAGSAIACHTCGNILIHNTVYHDKANNEPFASPAATPVTKTPEPAQNSAGVWHYTCEKGCAGGSGSAGTCSTCNGALAHNSAYH